MLQELEIVESNMLNTIFMYNKLDKQQLQETMKMVAQEHKSG